MRRSTSVNEFATPVATVSVYQLPRLFQAWTSALSVTKATCGRCVTGSTASTGDDVMGTTATGSIGVWASPVSSASAEASASAHRAWGTRMVGLLQQDPGLGRPRCYAPPKSRFNDPF